MPVDGVELFSSLKRVIPGAAPNFLSPLINNTEDGGLFSPPSPIKVFVRSRVDLNPEPDPNGWVENRLVLKAVWLTNPIAERAAAPCSLSTLAWSLANSRIYLSLSLAYLSASSACSAFWFKRWSLSSDHFALYFSCSNTMASRFCSAYLHLASASCLLAFWSSRSLSTIFWWSINFKSLSDLSYSIYAVSLAYLWRKSYNFFSNVPCSLIFPLCSSVSCSLRSLISFSRDLFF